MRDKTSTRRKVLATSGSLGLLGLAGCADLVAQPTDDDPADGEITQDIVHAVPQYLDANGNPEYSDDGLRFVDYSNLLHGIAIPTTAMRTSQIGNENYDSRYYNEEMPRLANVWADVVDDDLISGFARTFDGRTWPYLEDTDEGWVRRGDPQLEDLQHASYIYHMHHRGGRFGAFDGVFRTVTFTPPEYQASLGRYLLNERRDGGAMFHDEDLSELDNESMGYGLAAIHAHYYAWVRFSKPDGEGDMTRVSEDELLDFLGYSADVLGDLALDFKSDTLDDAWNDSTGVYEFDGSTYPIDAIGGLIRGTKALYDAAEVWGGDSAAAQELAERTIRMFTEIYESDIVEPWGLPAEVEFTSDGVVAASDTVDVQKTWEFVNHITGGYALTRDRFTEMLEEMSPETFDHVGEMTDELLLGAMDHCLDDGELVSELDYGSGDITDDRRSAAAIGIFNPAAVNSYGAGSAFAGASDWNDVDPEIAENSERLYDTITDHVYLLEDEFLIEA